MVAHRYNAPQSAAPHGRPSSELPLSRIHRSALVPRPAEQVFDLVNDVESYPLLFDWCTGARAEPLGDETVLAHLDVRIAGVTTRFGTRNRLARPSSIDLQLAEGPLARLSGRWEFKALGDAGCKVTLDVDLAAGGSIASRIFANGFGRIADRLVADFVRAALAAA
jgi:ribosome-associated toxin RatA of RatAB toxin-antitoxin module